MSDNSSTSEIYEGLGRGCLAFIVMALSIVYTIFLKAFVVVYFWEWFVLPYFEARPLNLAIAAGLSMLISVLFHTYSAADDKASSQKNKDKSVVVVLLTGMFRTTLAYGLLFLVGWILYLLVS